MSRKLIFFLCLYALLPAEIAAQAHRPDLGDIAGDLRSQGIPIARLITVICFVMGVVMAIVGLRKMAKEHDGDRDPGNKVSVGLVYIFLGAALVAIPALISSGITTIFGNTSGAIDITQPNTYINY